jgi:hypothetical protein
MKLVSIADNPAPDGVVTGAWIAGEQVWNGREYLPVLGTRKLGRPLTANGFGGVRPVAARSQASSQ